MLDPSFRVSTVKGSSWEISLIFSPTTNCKLWWLPIFCCSPHRPISQYYYFFHHLNGILKTFDLFLYVSVGDKWGLRERLWTCLLSLCSQMYPLSFSTGHLIKVHSRVVVWWAGGCWLQRTSTSVLLTKNPMLSLISVTCSAV